MSQSRRLAAVMFTDIVGYTALTQLDEAQSLRVLDRHNRLLRPVFIRFRGREVKTIGDSFLVEFESALDAVNCAVEIQRLLDDYNASSGEEWRTVLRIGVHLGDIVDSGGDILGDTVNIASRIQPLSQPGGVCVSGQVYDQVRNKIHLRMVKLEPRQLKGVSSQVDVYKIVMPWEGDNHIAGAQPEDATEQVSNRVAVLPFVNMSPSRDDEYFADGITEELIDRLAHVSGLEVIARTSVMTYKGEKKKASQVAQELKVGFLVEGSVRKAGNRVRVTVQLVNTITEAHVWSEHYDGTLDDIFAVQDEITERVVSELRVKLSARERSVMAKKPTEDMEAYTYYLQGVQLLHRLEEEPNREALQMFLNATQRDPRYAAAHAGICLSYGFLALHGYVPFAEAIEEGRLAALKAIQLDPDLAMSHAALALVMFMADERESVREIRRAIELDPNYSDGYLMLGVWLASAGNIQEAEAALEKAYALDPLNPECVTRLGVVYYYAGDEKKALEHWKRTMALEPYRTHAALSMYYMGKGLYEDAEKEIRELEHLGPGLPDTLFCRGVLAALVGDQKTAREMIAGLDKMQNMAFSSGTIHLAMGEKEKFFELMLRSAKEHTTNISLIRWDPLFADVRSDPRVKELLSRYATAFGFELTS